MDVLLRPVLLVVLLQVHIQRSYSDVNHLTAEDSKCFPYDFNYDLEEPQFVRLLVVPYLDKKSLMDISRLEIVPETNGRYNEFLSCMWKKGKFQTENGTILFPAVEKALTTAIGREVGDTGPGINLSKLEAQRIVGQCDNLGGLNQGDKVIFVRNCILIRIKNIWNSLG